MGAVGILLLIAVVGLVLLFVHVIVPLAIIMLIVGVVGAFIAYFAGPYRTSRRY